MVLGFFAWWVIRPSDLPARAGEFAKAVVEGDTDQLYEFLSSSEISCSSLNRENFKKAYQILIGDKFAKLKSRTYIPGTPSSNKTQATAGARLVGDEGDSIQMAVVVNQAEGGVQTTVMVFLILNAALFDDKGRLRTTKDASHDLETIRKYRSQLESIGISKVMLNPRRCVTWDELEGIYARTIDRSAQEPSAGQTSAKGSRK